MHQGDLVASDGAANDGLGFAVAISGDTAIVGTVDADSEEGGAYVFVRTGSTWSEQQRLVPTTSDGKDWFGYAVAVDGDTALIGAPHQIDPVKQTWPSGRALVFKRSGSTWTQAAVLTASPQQATDDFGYSVALAGDIAVVGAPGYDVGGVVRDQGEAYVFQRIGDTWSRIEQLYASDRATADGFGTAIAATTDTIIVGGPYANIGSGSAGTDQGAAYVYSRSGDVFSFDEKLTLADGTSTGFGGTVSISGTTALIGATHGRGAAQVFEQLGANWTWQCDLLSLDGVPSVSPVWGAVISGATALIGMPYDKAGTSVTQGVAYRFTREGSTWTYRERFSDENDGANRLFGYDLALSAGTAVISALGDTVGVNTAQGVAHVFLLDGDPLGASCASGSSCSSGICANAVCCDAVCNGACLSCVGSETGVTTGTCAPAAALCPPAAAGAGGEGGADSEADAGGESGGALGNGSGGAPAGGAQAAAGGESGGAGGRGGGGGGGIAAQGGAAAGDATVGVDDAGDNGAASGATGFRDYHPTGYAGCGCRLTAVGTSPTGLAGLLGAALALALRRQRSKRRIPSGQEVRAQS